MELQHYLAVLVAIAALNWVVRRLASPRANKFTFLATAGMPIAVWTGLMAYLLFRDGVSTLESRYFSVLLMLVGGCTVATAAAALLGQALGRPGSTSRQ